MAKRGRPSDVVVFLLRLSGGNAERTYWFIKLVFPTPLSPRIMTLRRTFFLDDMVENGEGRVAFCYVDSARKAGLEIAMDSPFV